MTKSARETKGREPNNLAYVLRLWRMQGDRGAGWRASLMRPGSGERLGFASLDDLFVYLRRQTDAESEANDDKNRTQKQGG